MKYPPNSNILRAIAAGRVGWPTAASEWIDNAFDRKASSVAISFEKNSVTISDNGEGTATPQKIVQLGEHTAAPNGLGEYGMGGTESLLWAGGERSEVFIRSVHRGLCRSLKVNWQEYACDWELPDPTESAPEAGRVGTTIQVSPLRGRAPSTITIDALLDELGYLYSHAIRTTGKQITVKGPGIKERPRVVSAWIPPQFDTDVIAPISATVDVDGRQARVHVGVVKNGVRNLKSGLTYWYNYRVILPASARGCGDFNIGRVCGFVELLEGWKSVLTRNKNGLTVGDDALFAAIEAAIQPVLEAAERVGSTFALSSLSDRLATQIGAMLNATKDTKAKRDKGETQGAVAPKWTPRVHQQAKQQQPGVTFPGTRNGRCLKIGYEPLGGNKIGEAKPPTITLNTDNTFIANAIKENKDDVLLLAIIALIADYDCKIADGNGQRYLKTLEPKEFPEQVGTLLAASPSLDGKPVAEQPKAELVPA